MTTILRGIHLTLFFLLCNFGPIFFGSFLFLPQATKNSFFITFSSLEFIPQMRVTFSHEKWFFLQINKFSLYQLKMNSVIMLIRFNSWRLLIGNFFFNLHQLVMPFQVTEFDVVLEISINGIYATEWIQCLLVALIWDNLVA